MIVGALTGQTNPTAAIVHFFSTSFFFFSIFQEGLLPPPSLLKILKCWHRRSRQLHSVASCEFIPRHSWLISPWHPCQQLASQNKATHKYIPFSFFDQCGNQHRICPLSQAQSLFNKGTSKHTVSCITASLKYSFLTHSSSECSIRSLINIGISAATSFPVRRAYSSPAEVPDARALHPQHLSIPSCAPFSLGHSQTPCHHFQQLTLPPAFIISTSLRPPVTYWCQPASVQLPRELPFCPATPSP